jgi:F-type H+-transporting ATPase subunit a
VLGLEFPNINEVIRWDNIFGSFNKIALIACLAAVIGSAIFILANRKDPMKAPKGVRNLAETIVEFIEDQIIMPTMGRSGMGWTPFLLSLFIFIYLCNLPGIIPVIYMPATARIAIPMFLALLVWVIFIGVGFKHQGFGYIKNSLFPPGVPGPLYVLVAPIEFISTFLVRPFSLLTEELIASDTLVLKPVAILPFFMLLFITSFEVLVGFLQAYIFTILAAVYIGGAAHPEH